MLACEQLLERIIYELRVIGVYATTCKMSPNARYNTQLGAGHVFHYVFLILWRKVEILFCGHHDRLCLDGAEGLLVVALGA